MDSGKYKDKTYIGTGGMALVYRAYDEKVDRNVAIKELAEQLRDNHEVRAMFIDDARKMASVKNHNVVHVYEVSDDEVPTIVMEYMAGGSLAARMGASGMPASTVVDILEQVINGLKAIHDAGMIHRDIKPENILEDDGSYKITDFGVAMRGGEDTVPFVTNKYAAPEVLADPESISPASDIYSLGVMGAELLLGSKRFEEVVKEALEADSEELQLSAIKGSAQAFWQQWVGGNAVLPPLHTLDESIPPELSDFLARLMARRQSERPQDCAALLSELVAIKRAEGLRVSAVTEYNPKLKRKIDKKKAATESASAKRPGRPLWFKLVAGFGVLFLLATVYLLMRPSRFYLDVVTDPPGASVTVNGQLLENDPTPTWFDGDWGDVVVFQAPGGEPVEVVLEEGMAGLSPTDQGWRLEVELGELPVDNIRNSAEAASYLKSYLDDGRALDVRLDGYTPREGEYQVEVGASLNYLLRPEQAGRIMALHLSSDNRLTLIYPDPAGATPEIVEPGETGIGPELNLLATEPLGREWMVFLVVDEVPAAPVVRGALPVGNWALSFPFGGHDSPGRDMVLWVADILQNNATSAAIVPVEVVYRLSET